MSLAMTQASTPPTIALLPHQQLDGHSSRDEDHYRNHHVTACIPMRLVMGVIGGFEIL